MKFVIERGKQATRSKVDVEYQPQLAGEKPVALDVLLQAQNKQLPDLAYRYGCRNGLCGVCTIEVNGKPRLACRTKVKSGDCLSPLRTLPILRDLVVKRDEINRQLLGRLPTVNLDTDQVKADHSALQSLNRCIECYACLHECPIHTKNPPEGPYQYGNPYSFLRIQQVLVDPSATKQNTRQALQLAQALGIEDYDTGKVPKCGVGINLKNEVVAPLQAAVQRFKQLQSSLTEQE